MFGHRSDDTGDAVPTPLDRWPSGRPRPAVRILTNSETLSPNTGISVQTVQIAEELARRGHAIDLLYIHDGPYRDRYASFCDTMQQVPALDLELRNAPRQLPRLVPAVRAGVATRPDVIYLHRFKPLPWALATAALTRAPVVCHLHGLVGLGTPAVNRGLGRFTTRFICVSAFVQERFVAAGGDPGRTSVVLNGIDPAQYPWGGEVERASARAELGLSATVPLVLFFGRVAPEKGVAVLVEAMARLHNRRPSAELVLMGPYLSDDYHRLLVAKAPGVTIHHLPMRTDVVTPLHAADVVVVPSIDEEPFGRTVIEAMSTARPVIASTIGGIPEILTDDLADLLVPAGDVEALAAKLAEVLDWRQDRPDLGPRCADHVAHHFTLQTMVDQVERLLLEAAG